jgi:hypothetical protein
MRWAHLAALRKLQKPLALSRPSGVNLLRIGIDFE